jgi:hypothetical protein
MQLMRVIAALGAAATLVVLPVTAASAAGIVEVSTDGATWGSSLGSPLFTTAPELVPMGSESASFWVRNSAADDAYLRLTVDTLGWSGFDYAASLSIAASVPGIAGTPIVLASAGSCPVLLNGVLLPAGQAVQVTATLALGDLNGTSGQSGSAAMNIGVMLTQVAGTAPASGCASPVSSPGSAPATVVVVPSAPSSVAVAPAMDGEIVEVPLPPIVPGAAILAALPNTLVRFDSSIIGWAGAGLPLGAALFFLFGIIRRLVRGESEEQIP